MRLTLHKQVVFYFAIVICLSIAYMLTGFDSFIVLNSHNAYYYDKIPPTTNALSESDIEELERERFLIIFDDQNEGSVKLKNNIETVLQYMKKRFTSQSLYIGIEDWHLYDLIIFATNNFEEMPNNEWIEQYVGDGGYVFFAIYPEIGPTLNRLDQYLGIVRTEGIIKTYAVEFHANVLLKHKGLTNQAYALTNEAIDVYLNDNAIIHATAEDVPLLWETSYGIGKFMVFNGTFLSSKDSRGFLAGALSLLLQDFIYPILNMKIVYIDDFPAPFPEGFHDKIFNDYRMNNDQFYKEIWWTDMLRLAKKHNLKYTAGLIVTYNDMVEPPFDERLEGSINNLKIFGRELLKMGGEIGIHGYNHQSYVFDSNISSYFGYTPWKNEEHIWRSLQAAEQFVHDFFPQYEIQTYIPPSNVLGEEGRKVLKKGLPHLKNISSLYVDDAEGRSYVQEFSISPDGIVEVPRISSGFFYTEDKNWSAMNGITFLGVFSHFIHPDDVIDKERGLDYSWKELYEQFDVFLSFLSKNYPWLRAMTASEASREIEIFMNTDIYIEQKNGRIKGFMNNYAGEMYFILHTDKRITEEINCTLALIDENTYLVNATEAKFEIGLSESK